MFRRINLLPRNGNYFKANLHCHSTLSDGRLTAEEIKNAYLQQGYSIVAFTEHGRYSYREELNDDHFLALAAFEADINEERPDGSGDRARTYHINLYDTEPWTNREVKCRSIYPKVNYFDKSQVNHYLKEMESLGFIACYNHPYWSKQTYDEFVCLDPVFAMEIYNHNCERETLSGNMAQAYSEALRYGKRWFCLATDDNHNIFGLEGPQSDSFGGFTMIHADCLDYSNVIQSLKNGDFYCSTGPEFKELYMEDRELVVKCSPVSYIYVMSDQKSCYCEAAPAGEKITEARFRLQGNEVYIRVQCRDDQGHYLFSNGYFLDKINER